MRRATPLVAAIACVVLITSVAVPLLATAEHRIVTDGNDSRGPLDIRATKLRSLGRGEWVITTWKPWNAATIWDWGYLLVRIDSFASPRFDYYALIRSNGTRLVAELWRDREAQRDLKVRRLRVERRGRVGVAVFVPLDSLRFDSRVRFTWIAQTLTTGPRCRRVCIDRAPNRGSVQEPVPGAFEGVTPTPTAPASPTLPISPTPTSTTTPPP
ncbi:MAG TPA: hypothetical protein VNC78_01740 [Actinomycetota bacterium]|nr:hypothetical protein [Actinomycetota bacterium]